MQEITDYINSFDEPQKGYLREIRKIILSAAPGVTEVISYRMPAVRQNKVLVYYDAHSKHIGLYPTAAPIIAFAEELKLFKTSKGAIQLPLDQPLPEELIRKIVRFRLEADSLLPAKKKKS